MSNGSRVTKLEPSTLANRKLKSLSVALLKLSWHNGQSRLAVEHAGLDQGANADLQTTGQAISLSRNRWNYIPDILVHNSLIDGQPAITLMIAAKVAITVSQSTYH
jgi:hypothetical protein